MLTAEQRLSNSFLPRKKNIIAANAYEIKHTLNCECDNRWRIGLLGLTEVEEKEQQIEACLKNFRLQHQGSQVEGCEQSGCCFT